MENLGYPKLLRFGAVGVVIIFSVLIIVTAVFLTPNVDYSTIPNSTIPLFGIRYQIEYSSMPTIINGITASTSIIIGFTGAMVALFYRIFEDDDSTKTVLLISAFYEIVPLAFLLFVYIFLPLGFTDGALKLALVALGLSLVSFSNVMLGSFYRLVRKKKTSSSLPQAIAPCQNLNANELNTTNRYEMDGNNGEPKTTEEKIDRVFAIVTEDHQGRKHERFLSRLDGLNNAFLTLSIFLIGLFISQFPVIAANPMLSFPIITAILAMVFSFAIGSLGILRDLNGIRIMAWSFGVSCLILLLMIFGLVSFLNYFHSESLKFISQAITVGLIVLNTFLTLKFAKWLEGIFHSKQLEILDSTKMKLLTIIIAIFVIAVSIIISVIIFGIQAKIF